MSYAVKEIFLTLQGEGGQAGRPAPIHSLHPLARSSQAGQAPQP